MLWRKNSLELNGWAVAAMSVAQRNGLRTLTKHREPTASGARVLQRDSLRYEDPLQHMCEFERKGFVFFVFIQKRGVKM